MPTVSVIIPCYNNAEYLSEAVDSVLRQAYVDFEIIVIDDGSVDNTSEVSACFSDDKRFRYHYQPNQGLSAARNKGIELAKGRFIALLDADDIWLPEKLDRQMKLLSSDPDIGMVFTDFSTFDSSGVIASRKLPGQDVNLITYTRMFERNNFIYPSTVMVRKDVFDECGGFDTTLRSIEDYDMWLRIARSHKVAGIPEPLTRIRQHDSNMSMNIPVMLENELAVLEKNRPNFAADQFRRRQSKTYYLAADRLSCQFRRLDSLMMLFKAVACQPSGVGILVVIIKILLGGRRVMKIRRILNGSDSFAGKLYWQIYRRY